MNTKDKNRASTYGARPGIRKRGLPIRETSYVILVVLLLITLVLLVSISLVNSGFNDMSRFNDDYIRWQSIAQDMRVASDYLTEQARYYIETGEKTYVNNYFEETDHTKRREKAIESIKKDFEGEECYKALERALADSRALAEEKEFVAMRLKAESLGEDVSTFPDQIKNASTAKYAGYSAEEKSKAAHDMLFDDGYVARKTTNYKQTETSLSEIERRVREKEEDSLHYLKTLIGYERVLVIVFVLIVFALFSLNSKLIYKPLVNAIKRLKYDQPLEVTGAYEIRFMANTYNEVYEMNQENKHNLNYKATHDPLTKARNRSSLDEQLRALDYAPAAILIIDIDNYKTINDIHGHDVGDKVLVWLVRNMKNTFPDAHVYRLGGDEFCLMLDNGINMGKEYIKEKIDALNAYFTTQTEMPAITISCGAAFCENTTGNDAMKKADAALYEVKNNGKHDCRFAE